MCILAEVHMSTLKLFLPLSAMSEHSCFKFDFLSLLSFIVGAAWFLKIEVQKSASHTSDIITCIQTWVFSSL